MAYLLGIDIGTSSTKALICDHRGRVVAVATSSHKLSLPRPGWSEQDPAVWWAAVCKASRSVVRRSGVDIEQIVGVGLSGQMHGSVFLDKRAKPIRPAILWNDHRTSVECGQIEEAVGGRYKLIRIAGNPALTGFTAPKILWVRRHQPRVFERTRHILLPKDYIRLCMTGEYATEVSDASGTLLLDIRRRRWSRKLLKLLDLDPSLLPRCFESQDVTGEISRMAAKEMRLAPGTPVVGGGGDQAMGAIGNGVIEKGIVSATLGTSGVVFAHADEPVYDKSGRVHTMCSAVPGRWCVFGCMLSAAGCLQWYRDKLRPGVSFDRLIEDAQSAAPGCEGLFFLPYLTGERCPYPDPHAKGGWIGLTTRHDRPAMVRALLEGVTMGMRDQLQIFEGMGIDIRRVFLSGGGAKSEFWRQLQADVYGKPVATTHCNQGPAFGAALIAGVGVGVWPDVHQACNSAVREAETRRPNARLSRFYRLHHAQHQQHYLALAEQFPRMRGI